MAKYKPKRKKEVGEKAKSKKEVDEKGDGDDQKEDLNVSICCINRISINFDSKIRTARKNIYCSKKVSDWFPVA